MRVGVPAWRSFPLPLPPPRLMPDQLAGAAPTRFCGAVKTPSSRMYVVIKRGLYIRVDGACSAPLRSAVAGASPSPLRLSLLVSLVVVWSSGMIPVLGTGGHGFNSRNDPFFESHPTARETHKKRNIFGALFSLGPFIHVFILVSNQIGMISLPPPSFFFFLCDFLLPVSLQHRFKLSFRQLQRRFTKKYQHQALELY